MDPLIVFKYCPKCGKNEFEQNSNTMKKCVACGYEMFRNPTIGAAALVFDDQDRLMVVRRSREPAMGTLDLPGGFCDAGEMIEEAIIREVREETGIEVSVEKYLFNIPNDYNYKGIDLYPLDFFFQCRIKDMSHIEIDKGENSELLFLSKEEINPEDFGLFSIQKALKRLL